MPGKALPVPTETMGKGLDRLQPRRDNEMSRRRRRNAPFGQTRWVSSPQQGCLADPPFLSLQTVSVSHRDVQFSIGKRSAIPLIPPHHIQRISPRIVATGTLSSTQVGAQHPMNARVHWQLDCLPFPGRLHSAVSITSRAGVALLPRSAKLVCRSSPPMPPCTHYATGMHSSPSCDTVKCENIQHTLSEAKEQYL